MQYVSGLTSNMYTLEGRRDLKRNNPNPDIHICVHAMFQ